MNVQRIALGVAAAALLAGSCQGVPGPGCPTPVRELLKEMDSLRDTTGMDLDDGSLDEYGVYSERLVEVRAALAEVPVGRLSPECRREVVEPAAQAYDIYSRAQDLWRDCLAAAFCALQGTLDRMWSAAEGHLDRARVGLVPWAGA